MLIKNFILWAASRRWERFKICSVCFDTPCSLKNNSQTAKEAKLICLIIAFRNNLNLHGYILRREWENFCMLAAFTQSHNKSANKLLATYLSSTFHVLHEISWSLTKNTLYYRKVYKTIVFLIFQSVITSYCTLLQNIWKRQFSLAFSFRPPDCNEERAETILFRGVCSSTISILIK